MSNMFGTPEDVANALKRNEEIADGLVEKGFELTEENQDGLNKPLLNDTQSDNMWKELYFKQKEITKILEQKLKES